MLNPQVDPGLEKADIVAEHGHRADIATELCHVGRGGPEHHGAVNVPVYHASTILFPTLEALDDKANAKVRYGRRGTPTTFALEDAVCRLEEADGAVIAPSGAMAISSVLMAFCEAGAHFLISDAAYGPCRHFCNDVALRLGVTVTFYDPRIGAGIAELIHPNTKLIWMETPGSLTFEMQDVAAIVAAAKAAGVATAIDNTWSGGFFFKPLTHGVDIVVQAGTKYLCGHSDVMVGVIAYRSAMMAQIKLTTQRLGVCVGPDDAYSTLRGMRTLAVRMPKHFESGMEIASWLNQRPEVAEVFHPGLPGSVDHALWKRDFTGASGLFAFRLHENSRVALAAMMNELRFLGMGSSWGGFESLLVPTNPAPLRTARTWDRTGQMMRIHVGLENPDDLIADLDAGLARLASKSKELKQMDANA